MSKQHNITFTSFIVLLGGFAIVLIIALNIYLIATLERYTFEPIGKIICIEQTKLDDRIDNEYTDYYSFIVYLPNDEMMPKQKMLFYSMECGEYRRIKDKDYQNSKYDNDYLIYEHIKSKNFNEMYEIEDNIGLYFGFGFCVMFGVAALVFIIIVWNKSFNEPVESDVTMKYMCPKDGTIII